MKPANDEIAAFKLKLTQLRDELTRIEETGDEAAQTVELDQTRVGRLSRMDALQSQAMSIETKRRRDAEIARIDAALQRIEDDRFGLCLHCDEDIDIRRLQFDPAATLCIRCATEAEK